MKTIEWFADYTAAVRARIAGAAEKDGRLELGWSSAERAATLAEVDFKIEHTYKVREFCRDIAESEAVLFSGRGAELAELIGLYHDLGRFRQALLFGTMDDRVTGPHGEMSAEIFLQDAPKDGLTDEETAIISDALRCHNLFRLPEGLGGRSFLFAKLIRDADKMDIFRFYADTDERKKYRFFMSTEQGDYSPGLIEQVLDGRNLNVNCINCQKDRQLVQMSMVFDLNFAYSRRWVLESGYIAQIAGVAQGTADEPMRKVYKHIEEWLRT